MAASFFYSNSNSKSIGKLIFSSFGKILVLTAAFFCPDFKQKVLDNSHFFNFWEELGLGGCFCPSIQILIEKRILENSHFSVFGKNLVSVMIFLFKF